MESRKKIDDLLKSELGDYTEAPPPQVWSSLEKKLDKAPRGIPGRLFRWFGFTAVLCMFVASGIFMGRNNARHKNAAPYGNADVAGRQTSNVHKERSIDPSITLPTTSNIEPGTGTDAAGNMLPATDNNDNNVETGNKQVVHRHTVTYKSSDGTVVPGKKIGSKPANGQHLRSNAEPVISRKNNDINTGAASPNSNTITNGQDNEAIAATNMYNTEAGNSHNKPGVTNNTNNPDTAMKNKQEAPPAPGQNQLANKRLNTKTKKKYDKFEAGIKAGYEQSGTNDAGKKGLISGYAQFKISPKLAIMLQPAFKYATVSSRQIGNAATYYRVNPDGDISVQREQYPVIIPPAFDSFWIYHYTYTESHDSIVKSNHTGGAYFETELPLLLKFYAAKDFSIYGGVNMVYSKLTGFTERTYIAKTLVRTATESGMGAVGAPVPAPSPTLGKEIDYTGNPYSAYTGPQYPAPQGATLRFGYMLGFSYEFEKRWFVDMLLQQTFIKPNVQGGYNTYTPLSAPYLRLTLGYKLIR